MPSKSKPAAVSIQPPTRSRQSHAAWFISAITLALTAWAWHFSNQQLATEANARFLFRSTQIVDAVKGRMQAYEQVLRGGVGLFKANGTVSRQQWHEYVVNAEIARHFPGIQNMGVSMPIPAAQKDAHIAAVRAEGFAAYDIKPSLPVRSVYHTLLYVEPFNERNLRAFGFDMYSNPVRKVAMDRAIEQGLPSISGSVRLAQETGQNVQHGFIFCLPAYHGNQPLDSPAQRHAALHALICGAFRSGDLMAGIFGSNNKDMDLEIFDNGEMQADKRLYSSLAQAVAPVSGFVNHVRLEVGGHIWLLRITPKQAFLDTLRSTQSWLIAAAGVILALALFTLLRLQSQRESQAMQYRMRQWVDNLPIGLFVVDLQGKPYYANRRSQEILGRGVASDTSADELAEVYQIYREGSDIPYPNDRLPVVRALAGETCSINDLEVHIDGKRRQLQVWGQPIHSPDGTIEYGLAAFMDITERKLIERMKHEFVSTVSHELRTPLTSIRGSLGLILGGVAGPLPKPLHDLLTLANNNCLRLVNLINDILDIEKLAAGKYHFDLKPIDLVRLATLAAENTQAYGNTLGVRYVVKADQSTLWVMADFERTTQVLVNLMSNAAKFSDGAPEVEISIKRVAKQIEISVQDWGRGIPDAFRPRIFQQFAQADSSDTRKLQHGGTGLGLSIAKAIIEQQGGSIDFDSSPGQGSRFFFRLPEVAAAVAAPAPAPASAAQS